jgi:broad specificity phosphatase PhoE
MKKILIVRAGSPAWKEEDRLQGTLPLPISESGKEVLNRISSLLREEGVDCLYSSGNESSGPTSQYLSELCGFKTKKHPGLRELDCGLWQGLRIHEIKKRFGSSYKQWRMDPTGFTTPQGEAMLAAYERVKEAVSHITKKSRSKPIAIVAGQIVSALIECYLTQGDPKYVWQLVDQGAPVKIIEFANRVGVGSYEIHRPALQFSGLAPQEPACGKEDAGQPIRFEAHIA